MALAHSPRIVTDGLVFALDAGNTKSYPGSGTAWTDLSGNSNNGTLTNGPTYSSADGGSIVFDGTNDYLTVPASSDLDFGTGDFTVEFWMYRTAAGGYYPTIISHNYSTTPPSFIFQTSTQTGQNWRLYLGGVSVSITEGSAHSLNTWHHYAIVRNGAGSNNVVIYRDGSSVATGTYTNNVGHATVDYSIGGRGNGTLSFAGYISNFRIYKGKGLTSAEVFQNYNALKGRFGI